MNISSIINSLNDVKLNQSQLNQQEVSNNSISFQEMLNDSLEELNSEQIEGYKAMEGIATGKVSNLQEAVQRIEEAELSLKLALEVKNKAISAYREITRMQI
ncbi:flagellar hook-basal body complex protein FliE [Arcobacter vandammei]|uniref:flagellar hook-basal body complex protein FliE n=1 Tax=Arcobacter vandammei TaxID=2782243 RepID=UPI0018DF7B78|nr:flagellar hook-basal body complex protein FliE [Arcobacter vandammei]